MAALLIVLIALVIVRADDETLIKRLVFRRATLHCGADEDHKHLFVSQTVVTLVNFHTHTFFFPSYLDSFSN